MKKLSLFITSLKINGKAKPIIGCYGYWVILTYLSVASAVVGIFFALGDNIRLAFICLMFSGLCDMFDGPVARLKERTENEKNYGIQIDSLADIISFGAFPVVIGYAININGQTQIKMVFNAVIFSLYLLTALIRLAYFNVIEAELQRKNERRVYFEGLPTTSVVIIIPAIYSICLLFGISLATVYTPLLAIIAVAFILKIKIPKPRGLSQIVLALVGLAVILSILLLGGIEI